MVLTFALLTLNGARFGEPEADFDALLAEQGEIQEQIERARTPGTSTPRSTARSTLFASPTASGT